MTADGGQDERVVDMKQRSGKVRGKPLVQKKRILPFGRVDFSAALHGVIKHVLRLDNT